MCGPWGKRSHLGSRGSQGTRPARRGKRRAVGIRQWRRIDITRCLKIWKTGSSQHQATFMHRVRIIVHCVLITASTTITGIVFYCIICFRKINHLVVKNHLHSSSGVREVVSSTTILQFSREYPQVFLKVHKRQQMKNKIYNKTKLLHTQTKYNSHHYQNHLKATPLHLST